MALDGVPVGLAAITMGRAVDIIIGLAAGTLLVRKSIQ